MAKEKTKAEAEAKAEAEQVEEPVKVALTEQEQAKLESLETRCLCLSEGTHPLPNEMKELANLRKRPHKAVKRNYCPHCKRYFVSSAPVILCPLCTKPLATKKP